MNFITNVVTVISDLSDFDAINETSDIHITWKSNGIFPANIYLKVSNENTRKFWNVFKLAMKTPKRRNSNVFIINFEHKHTFF